MKKNFVKNRVLLINSQKSYVKIPFFKIRNLFNYNQLLKYLFWEEFYPYQPNQETKSKYFHSIRLKIKDFENGTRLGY